MTSRYTKTRRTYASLGEVSSGTMRDEDLIASFSWELSRYMKEMRLTRKQRKRFNALLRECDELDFDESDLLDASDYTSQLFDALDELAPPYATFGAHDGDGACYGFWPITDDDELPRLIAGDPIPREHWGEDVYLVNDHGNVDCGHVNKRGEFRAYWSVV
jgi:hypothetical protein